MARLRVCIVEGERVTLCATCEAALGPVSVPCGTCGHAAGGACDRCGATPTAAELARIPHPLAIGVHDEATHNTGGPLS